MWRLYHFRSGSVVFELLEARILFLDGADNVPEAFNQFGIICQGNRLYLASVKNHALKFLSLVSRHTTCAGIELGGNRAESHPRLGPEIAICESLAQRNQPNCYIPSSRAGGKFAGVGRAFCGHKDTVLIKLFCTRNLLPNSRRAAL